MIEFKKGSAPEEIFRVRVLDMGVVKVGILGNLMCEVLPCGHLSKWYKLVPVAPALEIGFGFNVNGSA